MGLKSRLKAQHGFQTLGTYIPGDHSGQSSADRMAASWIATQSSKDLRLLDLGCGRGDSAKYFQSLGRAIEWVGVDLADSPEVRARVRSDPNIHTFDGITLPFRSGEFDLVYSRQVLEHVRHPDSLMAEVCRVLRPGGVFLGSTSYMEPYHSFSIFNWTPYALAVVLQGAGLQLMELRPGADVWTMLVRRLPGMSRLLDTVIERAAPGHVLVEVLGRLLGLDPQLRNYLKIMFSGQLCFLARRLT